MFMELAAASAPETVGRSIVQLALRPYADAVHPIWRLYRLMQREAAFVVIS